MPAVPTKGDGSSRSTTPPSPLQPNPFATATARAREKKARARERARGCGRCPTVPHARPVWCAMDTVWTLTCILTGRALSVLWTSVCISLCRDACFNLVWLCVALLTPTCFGCGGVVVPGDGRWLRCDRCIRTTLSLSSPPIQPLSSSLIRFSASPNTRTDVPCVRHPHAHPHTHTHTNRRTRSFTPKERERETDRLRERQRGVMVDKARQGEVINVLKSE